MKKTKIFFVIFCFLLIDLGCKITSPMQPGISEIDISAKYERVYTERSDGYDWVFIEMEIVVPGSNYFYKEEKMVRQKDGSYIAFIKSVPTNSRFIVYIDDRMVFPIFKPGDQASKIGKKIYLNDHECTFVEGSYGAEIAKGRIDGWGNITDGW
ncbi:MAG: hypothetical protein Q6367_013980 [Candidatus Freyarchaeota archaeon]